MTVRLSWDNRVIGDSIKVYRDTSAFDFGGRPAALATIGASDREYDDNTAAPGTTYFYSVSVLSGASEAMIGNALITTASVSGFKILLSGDAQSGTDAILLSGDAQGGGDNLALS